MELMFAESLAPSLQEPLVRIAAELRALCPRAEFHHVGATAIPGSLTKGDVDVILRVEASEFSSAVEKLRRRFAINQPENWTECFASFADDASYPFPLGVQLVVKDSRSDFFLFLVDYFRANPEQLEEYNRLKQEFARRGTEAYRNAKERFLTPILAARNQ